MHAAIDVGMLSLLIMHQAVDDLLRHLAGRRVVEVDQRLPFDLELEYRKVSANLFNIECRTELRFQGGLYNIHGSVSLGLFQHQSLKLVLERGNGYAVDDLGAKRVGQQIARRDLRQSAALEIK